MVDTLTTPAAVDKSTPARDDVTASDQQNGNDAHAALRGNVMETDKAAAKTAAERQAAYRARRQHAGQDGNGERRLNLWISTGAALALERMARRNKVTKRQMLERLLLAEDDRITAGIDPDSPEWDAYFCGASVTQ